MQTCMPFLLISRDQTFFLKEITSFFITVLAERKPKQSVVMLGNVYILEWPTQPVFLGTGIKVSSSEVFFSNVDCSAALRINCVLNTTDLSSAARVSGLRSVLRLVLI